MTRIPVLLSTCLGIVAVVSLARAQDINAGRFVAIGGFYGEAATPCIHCHQLDGAGDGSGAFPRLSDQSAWYLYKSLADYAAGARPSDIMQPIARALTDEQRIDVAAYYASIEDAPYPAGRDADPKLLQLGGTIAAVGIPEQGVQACTNCHGPAGVGMPPAYPFLAGQFAPYLENQLRSWKRGRRDGDPLDVMEVIAKRLGDEQIRAVSVYFASLRPAEVTPDEEGWLTPGDAQATRGEGAVGATTGAAAVGMGIIVGRDAAEAGAPASGSR